MALTKRILNVVMTLDSGDVTLDASLDMHVNVSKMALGLQHTCTIDVFGLSQALRQTLLSQFTAWNKRQIEQPVGAVAPRNNFVPVKVYAGYHSGSVGPAAPGQNTTTLIFDGWVVLCDPISGPPNIGVRLTCYQLAQQKTQFISDVAPASATVEQYANWIAKQMGLARVLCVTSLKDKVISNLSGTTEIVAALLVDIQEAFRPNVAAFIDNNTLIVKDVNQVIDNFNTVAVDEFIGTPMWTEWGVEFTCLYDPKIQLAGAATLKSLMNPGLNKSWVITALRYNLSSRAEPFYVTVDGCPPA
ncbi:hypothetical protein B0G57_1204 [Trinickia symbiotica]|uniref:Uncharacterized protein n=1 Tax=Trinickia symbiotica TaxID=863227 RepID=A0A2N7WUQ8_9BURK|nr:hypothetical protein [Trinickia symbiotica]PMS33199.1 hypothetical protein C0Z20_24630 [Trinickia symbiotica]PPK42212.1 hypothetical protein B0G57_1204 [Trinickia symbiotica]